MFNTEYELRKRSMLIEIILTLDLLSAYYKKQCTVDDKMVKHGFRAFYAA
jgi:hypothetical protein